MQGWMHHFITLGFQGLEPMLAETPATASVEQMLLNDDSTANNYMAEFLSRRFRDVAAGAGN